MTTIRINQLSANAKSLDISTSRATKLLSVDEKQATVTTLWGKIKDFFGGNNREAAFAQLHKIIHQAPRDDGNQNLECLESFQTLAALASPTNTSLFTMNMSLQEGRNVAELCIGFDVIKTLNLSAVESQQLAAVLGYSQDRLEGELLANPLKDHLKTVNTDNVNNNSFQSGGVHKKYFKGMLKAMDLVGNAGFILEKKIADYIEKKPNKNELKAVISLQEQIITPSHLDDEFTYAVVPVYNDKHVKSAGLDVSMATLSRDEAENLAQQAINLLRIFYTSKISHDDLHMHNLMVHKVDNGAVILQAIDFGRGKVEEDFKPYTDINYMFKRQGTNISETVTRNYLLPDSSEIKLKAYPLHYLLVQCSDRSMRDITSLLDEIGTDLVAELKTAGEGSTEIDLAFFNASNTIKQIYSLPSIPIPITSLGKNNLHGEVQSPTSKSSNVLTAIKSSNVLTAISINNISEIQNHSMSELTNGTKITLGHNQFTVTVDDGKYSVSRDNTSFRFRSWMNSFFGGKSTAVKIEGLINLKAEALKQKSQEVETMVSNLGKKELDKSCVMHTLYRLAKSTDSLIPQEMKNHGIEPSDKIAFEKKVKQEILNRATETILNNKEEYGIDITKKEIESIWKLPISIFSELISSELGKVLPTRVNVAECANQADILTEKLSGSMLKDVLGSMDNLLSIDQFVARSQQ